MYGLDFAPAGEIEHGPTIERIRALERRGPAAHLIQQVSEALRQRSHDSEGNENLLKEGQVNFLRELATMGGAFAPMPVGSGKTLATFLAPVVTQAQRPVLLLPASLKHKTRREYAEYFQNWKVRLPEIVSYEEMGREDRTEKLNDMRPDLLILDEAHRVKNPDASSTRKILRYIDTHKPMVACLSGTLIDAHFLHYWHLARASLRERAPVPILHSEAERWANALDKEIGMANRVGRGALDSFPGGYFEWLRGTKGVAPSAGNDCGSSIEMRMWNLALPDELTELIAGVVETSLRPDGEELATWDVPDYVCQLSQGFYYVWDPLPPDWWLEPRKRYNAYVRAVLDEHLDGLDSPLMVANALERGRPVPAAHIGMQLRSAWKAVKDRFTPNCVPRWVHVGPLVEIAKHAQRMRAIVWTRHSSAGEMLEKLGLPYFGAGTNPESAAPGKAFAASIQAHATGKNLQKHWNANLVLTPSTNATTWEQLIGRTHRLGQSADTVIVEVLDAAAYHKDAVRKAIANAKQAAHASGALPKLLLADSDFR